MNKGLSEKNENNGKQLLYFCFAQKFAQHHSNAHDPVKMVNERNTIHERGEEKKKNIHVDAATTIVNGAARQHKRANITSGKRIEILNCKHFDETNMVIISECKTHYVCR